jgi:hypothetical protein
MAKKKRGKSTRKAASTTKRAASRTSKRAAATPKPASAGGSAPHATAAAVARLTRLPEAEFQSAVREHFARRSEEVVALRAAAEMELAKRLAAYRAAIASPRALRAGAAEEAAAARVPRIVAEGDSWFAYPDFLGTGGNVIDHLARIFAQNGRQIALLNLASNGDEARQMLSLTQHRRLFEVLSDSALRPDVLLFSGGGNDLVGDYFSLWLKHKMTAGAAADALHAERIQAVLGVVRSALDELMALRDGVAPQCWIVTHGYAIPFASGEGVCHLGPWLQPSLLYRGWTTEAEQRQILRDLLMRFDVMLDDMNDDTRRFRYVRTQALLPNKADWDNELHPSRAGFQAVAQAFYTQVTALLP